MENKEYTKMLRQSAKATNRALHLLKLAEEEYERRYGANPSDADDDAWIDAMTGTSGGCKTDMTAEEVERGAVDYAGMKPYLD